MQQVFFIADLLLAQHVSGTIMPIIRSSRVLYSCLLPVVFGALVFKLSVWCLKHVEQAIRSAIKTSVASIWNPLELSGLTLRSSAVLTHNVFKPALCILCDYYSKQILFNYKTLTHTFSYRKDVFSVSLLLNLHIAVI